MYVHPTRPILAIGGTLAACAVVVAATALAADVPGNSDREVLVLRNGQVLTGSVTRLGDRYIIVLGNDAEINLSAADVALYCSSIDEAYHEKRETIRPDRIDDRLDLAQWCLTQGLTARAADQLLAAKILDPTNRRVALLERRLVDAPAPGATEKTATAASGPTVEELDQLTRSLDAAVLERFVSTVQPVLLNRCSTSGCHGPNSTSSYRVLRPSHGDIMTRRFTQRNLHATLGQIDRDAPETSPLLKVPLAAHGTADEAIFGDHDLQQHEAIADWVQTVAQGATAAAPLASVAGRPPHVLMQRDGAGSSDGARRSHGATPAPRERAAASALSPLAAAGRDGHEMSAASTAFKPGTTGNGDAAGGARGLDFTPRDEFDPEIFNRLYLNPPQQTEPR